MATPGRSTVVIFVICVVAVGGAAFYVYGQSGGGIESKPDQFNQVAVYATDTSLAAKKTGTTTNPSADWRAQFAYATTSQYIGKTSAGAAATPSTPNTITETMGIDMMAKFADLKQANLLDNADVVNQTVGNMLSTDINPAKPKVYSTSDLHMTASADTVSMTTFGNALANIINSYAATTSEFSILQDYTSSNDPTVLASIDPAINEQKRMLTGLISIPVPQPLLHDELNLINGMSTLEGASESIRVSDSDVVRGLVGTSLHVDGAEAITTALSNIYQILDSNGIAFGLHWEILNSLLN